MRSSHKQFSENSTRIRRRRRRHFRRCFRDNFRLEAVSDGKYGVAVERAGVDVLEKFDGSSLNCSRDIRAAYFVMGNDNERRPTILVITGRMPYEFLPKSSPVSVSPLNTHFALAIQDPSPNIYPLPFHISTSTPEDDTRNVSSTSSNLRTRTSCLSNEHSKRPRLCPSQRVKEASYSRSTAATRPTFSRSLIVFAGTSALSRISVHFVDRGVKVNGPFYRDVLLRKVMRRRRGDKCHRDI